MKLTITVDLDNDAFLDGEGVISPWTIRDVLDEEVAHLTFSGLELAPGYEHKVRDYNGNTVGHAVITEK